MTPFFVQAQACSKNRGIINEDGSVQPTPHNIYVDHDLMADIRERMMMTLASSAEAIFTIMGFPMTHLRQSAVALDKWKGLVVSHCLVILDLVFNTRKMTVGVTPEYRREVLHLLDSHWVEREAFHIKEMEELVGKLGRIGQAYHTLSTI